MAKTMTPERKQELRLVAEKWRGVRLGIRAGVAANTLDECLDRIDTLEQQVKRAGLRELSQMTEDFGGYDAESSYGLRMANRRELVVLKQKPVSESCSLQYVDEEWRLP